jgi:hypothetical protein
VKDARGPRFRPKHPPTPDTLERRHRTALAAAERIEKRILAFEKLGGQSNVVEIGFNHTLAKELRMPTVRHEDSGGNVLWYAQRFDAELIQTITRTYPWTRVTKLGKRLRKHLPAIKAALALGAPNDAIQSMIREAVRR